MVGLDHPKGLAFASDGYLWAGGEAGQVYRISPDGKETRVVATTGGFCLGLAFDRQDNLYICDHELPAVVKVTPDGRLSLFADEVAGRRIRVDCSDFVICPATLQTGPVRKALLARFGAPPSRA